MSRRVVYLLLSGVAQVAVLAAVGGAFEPIGRWGQTASNTSTGLQGSPITLTWSLVPDGTLVDDSLPSTMIEFLDDTFGRGDPLVNDFVQRPWFSIFDDAFSRLSELAGVTYVYESHDTGTAYSFFTAPGLLGIRGDVRIGGHPLAPGTGVLAYNYFPDYGDMVINTDFAEEYGNPANNFRYLRNVLMHEAGHGLGLAHVESIADSFLMEPFINTTFDGPQLDDILAIQRLYGDTYEKNGGNDSPSKASPLGVVTPTEMARLGTDGDSTQIDAADVDFLSIDDNDDTDFFSFTLQESLEVTLTATPKGLTYSVGPQGGDEEEFDSLGASNLSLALLSPNGSTVLRSASSQGRGLPETITQQLSAGTYYARVKGVQSNIQLYELMISAVGVGAETVTWAGVTGVWDVEVTEDWVNADGPEVFENNDSVIFDDTADVKQVTIAEDVRPVAILVDADSNYSFGGPGGIKTGTVTVQGGGRLELANSGNSYAGETNVLDGTLRITGDANAMVSPIFIAAGAELEMDATDAASMGSEITVGPGGLMTVGTTETDANVLSDGPVNIVNAGQIQVFDGEKLNRISGSGDITLEQETSQLESNPLFSGTITVKEGAVAEVINATGLGTAQALVRVENGGELLILNHAILPNDFELTSSGSGNGALRVAANKSVSLGGEIDFTGTSGATLRTESGASLTVFGDVGGPFSNTIMTLDAQAGSNLVLAGRVELGAEGRVVKRGLGAAELAGAVDFGLGATVVEGVLRFAGTGELDNRFLVEEGATLEVATTHTFAESATLAGAGEINGDITMPGLIEPGESTGILTFRDDLTLTGTSTLRIEIAGLLQSALYDQVIVDGEVQLDGTLEVALTGGFNPLAGNSFNILLSGLVSGAFSNLVLPTLDPGLTWDLDYTDQAVILSVNSPLAPADFNSDGSVDGLDLGIWARHIGFSDATRSQGDANDDAVVDGDDFLSWQRQFDAGAPIDVVGAAVPEPSSAALALVVAAAWLSRGGVRRK